MISIKVKSKTGQISELTVEEIIAIDGRPFRHASEFESLSDAIVNHEARITRLEEDFRAALLTTGGQANG